MIPRLLLSAALALIGTCASAADPVLTLAGAKTIALNRSTLSALPSETITATSHGSTATYDGYDLASVLKTIGATSVKSLRGKELARTITVSASDGYRVVFTLSELDPTLGNRRIYLVDKENGNPLADKDGPWRLVIPADKRPARWVRQVSTIAISD